MFEPELVVVNDGGLKLPLLDADMEASIGN